MDLRNSNGFELTDLPTWLNPKPGGCGPKHSSSRAGARKIFWTLVGGSGSMLPQKILKISVLRLAENAFPTF